VGAGAIARTNGAMPGALVLCRETRVTRTRAFERVPETRASLCLREDDEVVIERSKHRVCRFFSRCYLLFTRLNAQ